jgi:hypothetical protein
VTKLAPQPVVRRFWFEFDLPRWEAGLDPGLASLYYGVGVTGFDTADCLWMIRDLVSGSRLPHVRSITADVVLAGFGPPFPGGLGVPVWRGVWFPPVNLGTSGIWRPRGAARAINPSIWPPNPPGRAAPAG